MNKYLVKQVVNTALDGDKIIERSIELTDGEYNLWVEESMPKGTIVVGEQYSFDLEVMFYEISKTDRNPFYQNQTGNSFSFNYNETLEPGQNYNLKKYYL